jgi:hypothetical protein
VLRLERDRLENQQVERPLYEVRWFAHLRRHLNGLQSGSTPLR